MDVPTEVIALVDRYEALRVRPPSLELLEVTRDLREWLQSQADGVVHGGFRYTCSRRDVEIVRLRWIPLISPGGHRRVYASNRSKPPKYPVKRKSFEAAAKVVKPGVFMWGDER